MSSVRADPVMSIWTIGHSTRTFDEFLALLRAQSIQAVADVRRFPGSRKYPHFNAESFSRSLEDNGIHYFWFEDLGGRRKPNEHSHNLAWRNDSFRAYADYMETDEFARALKRLLDLARAQRTAIMCSEAGGLVAMPSLAHCRCTEEPGRAGAPYPRSRQGDRASVHLRRHDH